MCRILWLGFSKEQIWVGRHERVWDTNVMLMPVGGEGEISDIGAEIG